MPKAERCMPKEKEALAFLLHCAFGFVPSFSGRRTNVGGRLL
jgi:hypothetical protein